MQKSLEEKNGGGLWGRGRALSTSLSALCLPAFGFQHFPLILEWSQKVTSQQRLMNEKVQTDPEKHGSEGPHS